MVLIEVPVKSFVDEIIHIQVSGLIGNQSITIQAQEVSERNQLFHSIAHYIAGKNGIVKLNRDHAIGGSFKGIYPMGLFWSMKRPSYVYRSFGTLSKTDVTTPSEITLGVFDGHIEEKNIWNVSPIVITKIERWQTNCDTVDRISIFTDDVTGTLFVPRAPGQFPGVLDMVVTLGGILEKRAAILANHGFVTLALGFFDCKNRPDNVKHAADLDYVIKAVNFLLKHEKVQKIGIGVTGLSMGGTLALALAAVCPKVRCIVNIGGPVFGCLDVDITFKNQKWKSVKVITGKTISEDDKIQDFSHSHPVPTQKDQALHIPNFYSSGAKFLFLYSEDDQLFRTKEITELAEKMFKKFNNGNYKIITYADAGHILLPPYEPHIKNSYVPIGIQGLPFYCGGKLKEHALAQVKCWKEVISFLQQNLV